MKDIFQKIVVVSVVTAFFILMVGAMLEGVRYLSSLDNDNKKASFLHQNKEFLCRGGFERFLVSKSGGWSIKKDEFIKEDKFVSITECQERE